MYSEEDYNNFKDFDTPEMLRVSLAPILLKLQLTSENCRHSSKSIPRPLGNPQETLAEALQVIPSQYCIAASIFATPQARIN